MTTEYCIKADQFVGGVWHEGRATWGWYGVTPPYGDLDIAVREATRIRSQGHGLRNFVVYEREVGGTEHDWVLCEVLDGWTDED